MAQWIIYGSNGVAKAKVKELELHDEWMAECFLTVSIKNATPISFAVGDYIDYRGERYTIQYDPNVIKKATSGSYGEGFTYDNIKFVGLQDEVVRCDFNDLVLNDNDMHYSALPTFPFYCESVDDLLDRIQANLEDLYPGQWIVIGLNTVRNSQRGTAVGRAQAFVNAYKQYVDPTGAAHTDPYGKQGVAETADQITCWDAMKKVHDDFELNFIVRGRVIVVGTAGVFTANTFRYGKGNGLKEIERIGESDQRIVTRLRAYGSEENLPAHYYNTVNKQVYANVTSILHKFDTTGADFLLNLDFDKKYFTYRSESYPGTTEAPNYIIEMKANDVTVRGYVTKDATSGKCYVYCESVAGDDDRDEPDATKMAAFVEALTANDRLDFVDYVNRDAFGEGHYDYATSHLPDNMAVSRLMLPGFPTMSLNAWVQAHKNDADKTWLAQAIADGFTFSTEIYRPYIDSPNKTQYGVRPGSVYFDGSDETENIHPTIEGMTYNDAPIDEVYAADQVEDNGVYPAGEEVKPIKITLPNLGFALDKYYEDGASIDMKNGMCGARSFKLTGKPKKNNDNRWVCEVERVHDDSLDLWFPYSDFQIHGSSEVGRDHGDKYVLTGVDMPDAYIDAAAVKLLQYSIEALKKNHAPRYTYQPSIDNIFMQRQHDTASASQGVVSLHDTLKAGDVFAFADTDLNIDANVIIDILTIRENGDNGIPDYQVTLRDEKQVGTIQKITNKVDSIISGTTSINGATGGGLTTRQIQSLINRYGGEQFLSKLDDDTAQGFITMLKGLQIGANFVPDILGEGGCLRMRDDGKVELVTDILYARMRAYFDSVVIREYKHESGNRIVSPAQGFNAARIEWIQLVEEEIEGETEGETITVTREVILEQTDDNKSLVDFFRCYWRVDDGEKKTENQFIIGDLAFCEHADVVNGSLITKRYWRVVVGRNAGNTTTEDGEAWIDLSNAHDANGAPMMTTISWEGQGGVTQTLSVKSFESSANSYPEAHDDICMLGCTTDTTRQGAIIEYVSGTDAPTYQIYQGLGSDATNPYVLTNKNQISFGYNSSTGKAYMNVYGDAYIGDRNRNTFLEYKQNGAGGNPELNIKAKVQILPNGSTINGQSIPDYIKDNQNNYDDTEVQQAISDLNDAIDNLQDQIDGSIETLYGDVDPSVPANDPYKDYTTDEKEKHLGDMYYNSTTGYAYRYDKSVEEVGGEEVTTYFWQIIRDTGITQAIADAAAALGLAETKAKIFTTTAGTLPTPPYKINDVWVNATYPANGSTYSNEILKCVTARAQGATANIADWAKASKYTDDSSLQNFISATYDPTIAGLTEQVDRKIESWFQSADPSADWYDDTQTPVLDVRADHVGDMWYSESTHLLKRYDSETTGEGEQAVTTYFWTTIQDQKAIDAYDNAAHAQDTADGKRRVFTAQPVAADAYDVGDLWVNATYPATGTKTYENDVLRCKTAKAAGANFNISHWQKASKYTDDSALTNFVNGDYADTIGALEGQLDKKAETWYQAADPSSDWYVVDPETQEVITDTRADHVGDLWYKTSDDTTWYYKRSGAGTEQDPYTYEWKQQNVPLAVFDKIDGKADIFVSKPSTYNKYDMWIIESSTITCPNADIPDGCKRGDIVIAKNKRTNSYTRGDWEKKDRYTDDSAFNGYINAFLNGSSQTGDSYTAAAIQKAIAGALGSGTVVDGGLLLSSLIGMRKYKGSGSVTELSSYDTWGGISGEYNANDETVQGGAKGHGIAAWYGGDMVDKEMLSDEEIAKGWGTGEGQYRWAKSVDRFDGSGYRADGNITWDEQGRVSIKDVTTIISSNNTDVLNELITFNNAFHFNLSQGTSTVLSIEPQAAFTNLYIRNTTNPNAPYHVATENWVDDHYVSKTFFRQLFRAFKPNATAGQADVEVQPNTIDATISNIKAMVGFWTEQYVSALGNNSDGGGGGASVLYGLNDVTPNATGDGVMGAQDGYVLTYNGTTNHWYAAATAETYVLPQATSGALGGIKIGYAASGKNYAIALDTNGKAYVNVPWNNTDSTKLPLTGGMLTNNVAEVLSINSTREGTAAPAIGFYYNSSRYGGICIMDSDGSLLRFDSTFAHTYKLLDVDNSFVSLSNDNNTITINLGGTTRSLSNTNTWRNIFLSGTEKLATGINTKGLNFVGDGKTTISFLAAGTGEGQSGNANYATLKISSTWRGIQDNLTSSSNTTDSLSAKQGYLLANGSARDNTKLPLTGGTLTGNLTINPSSGAKFIQIGTIRIGYDSDNNALKVYKVTTANNVETEVAANFYALGAISALGQGVDGGGGGQGDVTWEALHTQVTSSDRTIHSSYIADTLASYSLTTHTHTTTIAADSGTNQLTLAYGTKYKLTAGGTSFIFTMPSADDTNTWRNIYVAGTQQISSAVNTKGLNFAAGNNVSLSFAAAGTGSGQSGNANYGTITIAATDTTYSAGTGLSLSSGTFSINSTYQNYISHGESAYNSLSNYLPLTGGTIANANFAPFFILRNHTTNAAAIGFKHYSSGTTVEVMGYIGMNTKNGALLRWDYNTSNQYTILDSSNSSVSKSGETLSVKINGTTQSLTNTTYSANNGVGLSGTTFYNSGVRGTTINGNYLRVNTNGTNADLTIPYASAAYQLSTAASISGGNTATYPWRRVATTGNITTNYVDKEEVIVIKQHCDGGCFGILKIALRSGQITAGANGSASARWMVRYGIELSDVKVALYKVTNKIYADLYIKVGQWPRMTAAVIKGGSWMFMNSNEADNSANPVNAYTSIEAAATAIYGVAYTSIANSEDAATVNYANSAGNASTATKLQTSRTINGTSFDGSANITTANWGTARNISIADSDSTNTGSAVSVNGSAAVTLKLPATIKATLSGNASTATTLQTSRTIWGQSFNGSANVTGDMSNVGGITFSDLTDTAARNLLYQKMATNDYFRVRCGGTAANGGWVEIATADDGNEPIYVRQYTGVFTTVARTLTLLDGSGNTSIPNALSVGGNVTAGSADGTYIQIGGARIVWDNTNKALKVIQSDNSTAANFYATGAISALGQGVDGGGGGGQGDVTWALLESNSDQRPIALSHIQTALNSVLTNYLPKTGGTLTNEVSEVLAINSTRANTSAPAIGFYYNGSRYGGICMVSADGSLLRYNSTFASTYTLLDSANSSVVLSGSTLTVKINNTEKSITNTWRGIQDNLTSSTNTTESLSAKQGYLLANGSARDNTKLPLSGGTLTGSLTISAGNAQNLLLNASADDATWCGMQFKVKAAFWGGIGIWGKDAALKRYDSSYNQYTILDSGNSSVSKSGETLTVKINGTTQSLTNTNTTYSAGTGISLSGTTFSIASNVLVQGSVIDTHHEGNGTVTLDGTNELFAFYDRGGTCDAYEVEQSATLTNQTLTRTSTAVAKLSANVFNGMVGYNQTDGIYSGEKFAVYDLVLPAGYYWGAKFFWSFGNNTWKPAKMRILIGKYSASGFTYISRYSSDSCPAYGKVDVENGATGFDRLRIVVSKYSRLACFGITNYATTGLNTTYMNRCVDNAVYRNISPAKDNTWSLGTSSLRWKEVRAVNLYGSLTGNASTATKATQDSDGNAINSTYLKKSGGTMTGSLGCTTNGANINWGNITIYGGGSNNGTNSIKIGDNVTIGDCNVGGAFGMKSTGNKAGFRFFNSSGTSIGGLQSTAGVLQWINSAGTAYNVLDANNSSVSKSGETLTVKINGTSQSLTNTNTWRGIQDNLTSSTNTTESLSAKQGYLLANGSARDNTKLPLAGGTMTGGITLNNAVYLYGKNTSDTSYILAGLTANNDFVIGYGTAGAGYSTFLDGNNIYLCYGTSRTTGFYLNSSGNIGVGTNTPSANLHVVNEAYFAKGAKFNKICVEVDNSIVGGGARTQEINCYDGGLYLQHNTANGLFVCGGGGNVGIGTTSPSYRLHVSGDVYATGGVTSLSDIRKKDVVSYVLPLNVEQIANAPTIKFLWKDKREEGEQVGTIAQYWQKVLPWVVKDKSNELSLSYGVAALVAAITTARKVVDHEKRITELEKECERLRTENEQLKLKIA